MFTMTLVIKPLHPTQVTQTGQLACLANQFFTQSAWNWCRHGRILTSPESFRIKQIG